MDGHRTIYHTPYRIGDICQQRIGVCVFSRAGLIVKISYNETRAKIKSVLKTI